MMRFLLVFVILLLHHTSNGATTGRKSRPRTGSRSQNLTEPSVPKQSQPAPTNGNDKATTNANVDCDSLEVCHWIPLRINVAGNFPESRLVIESPRFVNVGMCVGSCSYRCHGSSAYKRSFRSIVLGKKLGRKDGGGCVPTKLENITATVRWSGKLVDHVFEDVVVKECGCVV